MQTFTRMRSAKGKSWRGRKRPKRGRPSGSPAGGFALLALLIQRVEQLASEDTIGAADPRCPQRTGLEPPPRGRVADAENLAHFRQGVDRVGADFNIRTSHAVISNEGNRHAFNVALRADSIK